MSEDVASRWRPHRAGIFNVWEYDDQTFEFGDGRLVLRGRNGSGKSNALALLFPFVFDGVMSASRMDPMGGARSMKSLLLGRSDESGSARYRHESGTGYVWMEFTRVAGVDASQGGSESAGEASTFTIGIGASATTQRDATSWFFVTSQRVGIDLFLHDDDTPKARRRLAESLGDGRLYDTADDFRAALDRRLFGLGTSRYRTLVDLLLTLRRPHLAGKLDTEHLSATLSAGLAEVDSALIDDVSHSFDDLDAMQHELDALTTALDAVERFLPTYREHLVGVARDRAQHLVDAQGEHRRIARERKEALDERDAAESVALGQREIIDSIIVEWAGIDNEIEAIQLSPAYQSATALAEVEKAATVATEHARQLRTDADRLGARADADDIAAVTAETRHLDEARLLFVEIEEWIAVARSLGVDLTDVVVHDGDVGSDAATAAVARRDFDIADLIDVARASERAADEADRRTTLHGEAVAAVAEAQLAVAAAGVVVTDEHDALVTARRVWITDVEQLVVGPVPVGDTLSLLAPLIDGADAGDPQQAVNLFDRLDEVFGDLDANLQRDHDRTLDAAERQRTHIAELDTERTRVANEPNPGPPHNPTRPDADSDTAGAPLYACVDFAPLVDDRDRAGFEAALAASGLLDAKVLPEGTSADLLDAVIGASSTRTHGGSNGGPGDGSPGAPTLADILVPVPVGGLDADRIRDVLAGVPLDTELASLRPDGSWRLGPLAGRFEQQAQVYIGHEARERRRAERLAELDATLGDERRQLDDLDRWIASVVALRGEVANVRASQPSIANLVAAGRDLDGALTVEYDRTTRTESTHRDAERSADAAAVASAELQRLAVVLSAPTDSSDLAALRTDLVRCGDRLSGIERRRGAVSSAELQAATASETADTSRRESSDAARRAADAGHHAQQEHDRYLLLQRDVGADAQQAVINLASARERKKLIGQRQFEAESDLRTAEISTARLTERVESLAREEARASDVRDAAVATMATIRSAEIADVLEIDGVRADGDEEGDGARTPLRAARAVLDGSGPVGDDAANRMEVAYRTIILDGLRAGNDPSMPKIDGIDIVRIKTGDGDVAVATLVARLRADNERLGGLLSTKEREIFETHLLTSVGDEIRQLLLAADHFEQQINAEMSKAPTASGLTVELAWTPIADEPGVREAVGALRYSPDMLSPQQREQLREFFVGRIDDVRTADPGLSFAEALTSALDYRAWHRFDLFARFADGKRQRVTRTFFRGLSGGEAATVLHLPLFAAAAAQYSSGDVAGPRLIALDEAFVGIDDQMRGRLMGLLTQLDLDVIVTSHEFWGFYEQVPNLVVYDLVRNPSIPGVFAQRFDWTATPT